MSYFFLSTAHFFRISARFLILVHLTKMRFSRSTHLLMCLSLNFNVQHKDWLTYSDGTDRPGELSYNFSQTTLLRWLTFLLGSLTAILTFLLFGFISSKLFLKYFVNGCLWKQIPASNSPQAPSSFTCLTIFFNSKVFNTVLEQLSCKKVLKFVLHDNYFFDIFFKVQIWYYKTFEFGLGHSFRKIK